MKKLISFILILCVTTTTAFGYESVQTAIPNSAEPIVNALGAIVIDADNGRVLFAKDINQKLPMASTTKIMSALITLEQDDLDEQFVVDSNAILVEGSSMGLLEGDIVDLKTLAYGMLLPSGNDAANVAAVKIAGSKQDFADMMNEKAKELGMMDTNFVTPSGLDDDNHYTTAYDMAILTKEALSNKDFREICKNFTAKVEYGNPPYPRMIKNHNKLLNMYDGCIGVKTGFTDNAQRCLVTAAERGGTTLIVVTLNCRNDFEAHSILYDYFFGKLLSLSLKDKIGQICLPVYGSNKTVNAIPINIPKAAIFPHEVKNLKVEKNLKPMLCAPVKRGEYLGDITVKSGDITVYESPLYAECYIPAPNIELSFIEKIAEFIQ